jgi:low temperature requirement protein LtrA
MLRAARMKHDAEIVDGFRLRGREVTRLEGFSDAVFGFALTLLVVSLDVPKNFSDLANTMRGFPAFAVCFLMLAIIWNSHYKFCRRYGLYDGTARFLTCVLLFLVLFYVYPLKFLFSLGINSIFFRRQPPAFSSRAARFRLCS